MRSILYDSVDRLERMLRTIKGWIDPGRARYDRVIRKKLGVSISSIPGLAVGNKATVIRHRRSAVSVRLPFHELEIPDPPRV